MMTALIAWNATESSDVYDLFVTDVISLS